MIKKIYTYLNIYLLSKIVNYKNHMRLFLYLFKRWCYTFMTRGVTNTQGGEYDMYHEYKVTNTTIYSLIQSI